MQKTLILPATTAVRKLPENITEEDLFVFQPELEKKTFPVYSCTLENACVTTEGVVYENGRLIEESLLASHHKKWFRNGYLLFQKLFRKKVRLINMPVLLCFNYWSDGYFHWITEVLPRLLAAGERTKDSSVLLPESWNGVYNNRSALRSILKPAFAKQGMQQAKQESLAPFKLRPLYVIPRDAYVIAENLTIITHPAGTGNYHTGLMNRVQTIYQNYFVEDDTGQYPQKIYISRAKSPRRKIVNEQELEAFLQGFGFRTLFFEELSFAEQVRHAYGATHVISLHGAGLTNILFMKKGSRVMELSSLDAHSNLCYYTLANAVDVRYYYQICKKQNPAMNVQDADVYVDLDKLKRNMELFLS